MATKHVTQLTDDLDGAILEDGEGQHIAFSVDGRSYEIDLSASNADALRRAFAPYIDAARVVKAAGSNGVRRTPRRRSDLDLGAVREWARANGHTVSDRGRMPVAVIDAYKATQV
ncbi:histone-like nucleoid-structuring protein Lsr2 [Microbacterium testaceum]|uniref:histone-like nucleoid-structuring protein Lsr2 n=1 Tax=Microbacterium testaceum TaxID=2033 RepID=UPI0024360C79|nr:Lsr2 family protein [Microbacterium testaceum]